MKQCQLSEQRRAEILLGSKKADAQAHLLTCDICAEAVAGQAVLWKALDSWNVPEVSTGFNRELFAKIELAEGMPWHQRIASFMRTMFAQPSLALGAAAFVVLCGFILDHPAGSSLPKQITHISAVQVSNTEAEQVEKTLDDLDMLRQFDLTAEEKETTSKSM